MSEGLMVEKYGMTRVFTDAGESIPVTVLKLNPTHVTQIKTQETDGYLAVQITSGEKKANRVTKALRGHYKKANVTPGKGLWELRLTDSAQLEKYTLGAEIKLEDIFKEGQFVDISGKSKGKGFAGVVKRHNFRTQDATHGNSLSHRAPGSIGQNQTPGRVFKNKKMAGQMGDVKKTVQNQQIVKLDSDKGLILVKGGVPGAPGALLMLKPAAKKQERAE